MHVRNPNNTFPNADMCVPKRNIKIIVVHPLVLIFCVKSVKVMIFFYRSLF